MKKPLRRKPGRPREDRKDQLVVDLGDAIEKTLGLGPQRARDLAMALTGREVTATKLPRGAARKAAPHSVLIGYELPTTIEGRAEAIRKKRLKPRPVVVNAYAEVLNEMIALCLAREHLRRTAL